MLKFISIFVLFCWVETAHTQTSILSNNSFIAFDQPTSEAFTQAVLSEVAEKSIVGLGEVSHFTKECYELKGVLIHTLMRNGFNALVLEVDCGQALLWNKYVCTGEGNLDTLIAQSGWFTYRTKEFKSILANIRAYNETAETPFQVFGMEMTAIHHNLMWLNTFLAERNQTVPLLSKVINEPYPMVAFTVHTDQQKRDYWDLFFELKTTLSHLVNAASPSSDEAIALKLVDVLQQYATYVSQDDNSLKAEFRDQFSARNVHWCLNQFGEGGQIILWAHNGHVSKTSVRFNYDVLGHYLNQWYGDAYFAIGFTFNHGEFGAFSANGFEHFRIEESEHAFWPDEFAKQASPFLLFNIRGSFLMKNAISEGSWELIRATENQRSIRTDISESFNPEWDKTMEIKLSKTYDALIYFEESHVPSAIPWLRN